MASTPKGGKHFTFHILSLSSNSEKKLLAASNYPHVPSNLATIFPQSLKGKTLYTGCPQIITVKHIKEK